MSDCGRVELKPNEQLTFVTETTEYDVARKSWGYYGTPSTNGRLRNHNLRTALVANAADRIYVMLVEAGREADFYEYLRHDDQRVLIWLDADDAVQQFASQTSTEGISCQE